MWDNFPLRTRHKPLNILLAFVPATLILYYLGWPGPVWMFLMAALAVVPLAATLGEATETLAVHLGPSSGALLNATMGNATELILGFFMLKGGQVEIVKASLSGSIIGNILLVLGMSALVGGLGREKQQFSRRAASVNCTMLFIAVTALVIPAIYSLSVFGKLRQEATGLDLMSRWTSVVLILVYALNLFATIRGRRVEPLARVERPARSAASAILSLAVTTVLLAFVSHILVAQVEQAKRVLGLSDLFMGVVVIATIGNAAEHATAVLMARRDRMELALGIAVGSSVQIALLVAPVLVLSSLVFQKPMSLIFTPLEIAGVAVSVAAVTLIALDGESTWLEGAQLLAVYSIMAIAIYFVP